MLIEMQNVQASRSAGGRKTPAVFLHKDGTLVEDILHNAASRLTAPAPGATEGFKILRDLGFALFIAANQPGRSTCGYCTENDLAVMKDYRTATLNREGVPLEGFYCCPRAENGRVRRYRKNCACREPEPGLLLKAARDYNIDLSQSWTIGDILDDVETGNRAGCKTVLVNNGNEAEWRFSALRIPRYVARSLTEAFSVIATVTFPGASDVLSLDEPFPVRSVAFMKKSPSIFHAPS